MSVPPFGIVGWASPITAAGVLFPGWGWLGLLAAAIGLLVMTTKLWPITLLVLGGALTSSAVHWTPLNVPEGWTGINTNFQYQSASAFAGYDQHKATIALVRQAVETDAKRIVLPESALGMWTPTSERIWMRGLQGLDVSVFGGAVFMNRDGYDNVLLQLTGKGANIIYRERMPVPVSMWRPWSRGAARAYIFTNPTVDVDGIRIASVICYEQLLIWPVLQSMLLNPDVILAVGNGWWTGGTNIVAIQKAVSLAWATLFSVPSIIVFNT